MVSVRYRTEKRSPGLSFPTIVLQYLNKMYSTFYTIIIAENTSMQTLFMRLTSIYMLMSEIWYQRYTEYGQPKSLGACDIDGTPDSREHSHALEVLLTARNFLYCCE